MDFLIANFIVCFFVITFFVLVYFGLRRVLGEKDLRCYDKVIMDSFVFILFISLSYRIYYILFNINYSYNEITILICTMISFVYTLKYFFKKIPIRTPKDISTLLAFMIINYIFSINETRNFFEEIFEILLIFDFVKRNFFDKHPMQPEIDKASLPTTNE
jgi:hypothetical protein